MSLRHFTTPILAWPILGLRALPQNQPDMTTKCQADMIRSDATFTASIDKVTKNLSTISHQTEPYYYMNHIGYQWGFPGGSVHGILQARILEWVASSFSRGSSWPKDQTPIKYVFGIRLFYLKKKKNTQQQSISHNHFKIVCLIKN